MQIFVETLSGKTTALEVNGSNTVEAIKSKVYDKEETSPDLQQLMYNGQLLEDKHTLSHYGLNNGSTVLLVSKPKGKQCIL